jgi:hypothetical protein
LISLLHVDPSYSGSVGNQTSTGNDIFTVLNVAPQTKGLALLRRISWRTHGKLLPLLHWRDKARAQDVDVNLRVLWNKVITSLDKNSPAYEPERWTFDMLPWSRWILRMIPIRLFPRWLHANIELRTVYLNMAVDREIDQVRVPAGRKIRIVTVGGGYDSRPTRLLASNRVQQAWELDIPHVAASKRTMLERLFERRKLPIHAPQLLGVDLNDLDLVQTTLENIAKDDKKNEWHTIVVSEAVLMYLDEGVTSKVLTMCRSVFGRKGIASFCFADRLEGVPQYDDLPQEEEAAGREFLAQAGWKLVDWIPKPGRACHMGIAH